MYVWGKPIQYVVAQRTASPMICSRPLAHASGYYKPYDRGVILPRQIAR